MMTKKLSFFLMIFSLLVVVSCGEKKEEVKKETKEEAKTETVDPMQNKGVGPIKNLELPATIDESLVVSGKKVYEEKCTACHKVDKKYIGPAPTGIMDRRSPEWIMNMILNPEKMILEDPVAKQLLMEYNGAPMANQSLTEEEARAILEYFRTLK